MARHDEGTGGGVKAAVAERSAMSVSIRVLCPRPLGALDPARLVEAARARLGAVGDYYGETIGAADRARLALEPMAESPEHGAWLHVAGPASEPVAVERVKGAEADEIVAELTDELAGWDDDEPGLARVRAALESVSEVVVLELAIEHTEGAGWPSAVALALAFAESTGGLAQLDGEGYVAPEGQGLAHVLDSD
jgi:hypothetical protein